MSRLPRFQRAEKVAPIRLTNRDQKIIRLIHRHRFLRSHQIITLIGGSAQNLSRRLQWLFHHGYLERPRAQLQYYERSGSQTIAYGLGNKSSSLLQLNPATWGEKNRAIGRMYLAHALLVSDVMVSLELACRQHSIRLLHEDELNLLVEAPLHWRVKIRDGTKLGVIPDRVFALEYVGKHGATQRVYYFLEADRDDELHIGFYAFTAYINRCQPKYFLHGHQHHDDETVVGKTRVIGTFGQRLITIL